MKYQCENKYLQKYRYYKLSEMQFQCTKHPVSNEYLNEHGQIEVKVDSFFLCSQDSANKGEMMPSKYK